MTAKYDPSWINDQGGCRVIWCLVMCLSDWLYKARTYNGTFNGTFFFALLTCIHGFSHTTFRFKRNFQELQFLPYFCLPIYVMFHLQWNLWKKNFMAERTTTKKLFTSHSYQWFKTYSKSAWGSQKNLKKQRKVEIIYFRMFDLLGRKIITIIQAKQKIKSCLHVYYSVLVRKKLSTY